MRPFLPPIVPCIALGLWVAGWGARPVAGGEALPFWVHAESLHALAQTASFEGRLSPRSPQPGAGRSADSALLLNNPDIKASLWGPANRITISLIKTDVFDRRYGTAPLVTLAQVREGAYAAVNKGFDDMPADRRRPVRGYLLPTGGRYDPYACWNAYPFPCQKPVGQIILGLDELIGAAPAKLVQSCADGSVNVQVGDGAVHAEVSVLLSMTRNVFAIRGKWEGIKAPWLRLYRHEDQSHRRYLNEDGTFVANGFDYAKDKAWNGPVAAPESGTDGHFFWIRQQLPAEKTFPQGFTYFLVGLVDQPDAPIKTVDHEKELGTMPFASDGDRLAEGYALIRGAPGSAATAALQSANGVVTAYVTVVTTAESPNPLAEAKRRLTAVAGGGYQKLVEENTAWYTALYDQREAGRLFYAENGVASSDSFRDLFQSWACTHGGGCKPDMRRYQASAAYAAVEQDAQPWHSLPCYNELFYTPTIVRNRADAVDMWWKVVEHWLPAARKNAQDMYGLPGMAFVHGYQPPVLADQYVHTNIGLELCVDTAAQVLKVLWDQWDYGGDEAFLKEKVYPALHDLAIFYGAYAQPGADGRLHVIPAMESEAWGIFPEFSRSKDAISALCMFRWTFLRAAEAAEVLGVDPELRAQWRELAKKIAPYPTAETKAGVVFNTIHGTTPSWKRGDHPWYVGVYPATLADEITLDSSEAERAQMIRTAYSAPARPNAEVLVLLGACPENVADVGTTAPSLIRGVDDLRREVNRYPERVLNSRSGRIHLFPCVPRAAEIGFRNFQARGAFLISAFKDKQGVRLVEIEARRNQNCQLMNPWPSRAVAVRDLNIGQFVPSAVDSTNGECVVFATQKGHQYKIEPKS